MPSQSSSAATDTGSVRLAHVFVRIPSDNQQGAKPASAAHGQEINETDRSEMSSAPEHQQALPPTSTSQQEKGEEPRTPQKKPASTPTLSTHFPPTPSPTPTKNPLKRALHHHHHHPSPQTSPLKRPRIAKDNPTPSHSTPSTRHLPHFHRRPPKFSLAYHTHHSPPPTSTASSNPPNNTKPNRQPGISWQELKRCAESVMRQVDWAEVVADVAGNRSRGAYKRAVRGVLQGGIEEIVRLEERGVVDE